MHPSSAKVMTSSSGALAPTSPSVEPKLSINGAPNPVEIAARSSGVQVSLVLRDHHRRDPQAAGLRSRASRASTEG